MSNEIPTARARGARAALVVAVAFLTGAVAGAATDRALVAARVQHSAAASGTEPAPAPFNGERDPREPPEREGRRSIDSDTALARLRALRIPDQFAGLGLSSAQIDRLAAIAKRRRPQSDSVNAVLRALRPTVQHMETEMMQEMVCALSPAQQSAWLTRVSAGMAADVVAERYRLARTHTCPAAPASP